MTLSRRGGPPRDLAELAPPDRVAIPDEDVRRRARLAVALQTECGLSHSEAYGVMEMLGLVPATDHATAPNRRAPRNEEST